MKTLNKNKAILVGLSILLVFGSCKIFKHHHEPEPDKKPVIYLYPDKEEDVSVKLDYDGKITCTYPDYKDGWKVKASPDGKLLNYDDNKEYSYLFWEGESNYTWDFSKLRGFVVKGSDTKTFLQTILSQIGLNPKEYNEFIVYWLPQMQQNKYNLIHFAGKEYTSRVKLIINPIPDTMLRVFMVFMPLDKEILIQKQEIKPFERRGFTVVEWGGTTLKTDTGIYQKLGEQEISERDLEGTMFQKWYDIETEWRTTVFNKCLAQNHIKLSCSGCESIYLTVKMKIDANGKLVSHTKVKSKMCGEEISPKLEKCFMDYFYNYTFPAEFRNIIFEVQLGNGLKC